jgi:glutamate/tyrosine decarboxylase-like PLP-dependent enzyme
MTRQSLPEHGTPWPELKARMAEYATGDVAWREGKTAVDVFNAGPEIEKIQKEAFTLFMSENGLGPAAFPSLKRMEEEVVGFGLNLLHAPDGAAGTITAGGSDSIFMAIKAAQVMEIEVRRIPVKDYLADPDAMAAATDGATMMIVGSAPCFPYGLIDPIAALSDVAQKHGLWLHVDACVGGYLAPFVRMNGAAIQPFDFELPGVMSMSADLHKYGYAAKGASTVFYRTAALHKLMTFDVREWPGGRMMTPTLAGTRPGGSISAAWAVMNALGVEGYREKQGLVVKARETIEAGARRLGFDILGRPQLGLMAFTHPNVNGMAIWQKLRERGWFTSVVTEPVSLHLMLSPFHTQVADAYLADLEWALDAAKDGTSADPAEARYS